MPLVWTRQNWFMLNAALSGSTTLVGVSVEQLGCSCIVVVGLVCFFALSVVESRDRFAVSLITHIITVCVCLSVNGRRGNACQTGKRPHGRCKVRSDTANLGGDVETLTFDIPLQLFFKHMVKKSLYVVDAAISSYPKDSFNILSFVSIPNTGLSKAIVISYFQVVLLCYLLLPSATLLNKSAQG